MVNHRILDRPSFSIIGRKTWISGPDNEQFGRFWVRARAEGLLDILAQLGSGVGPQTGGVVLGVSRVEKDPANRAFHYMIAIEEPEDGAPSAIEKPAESAHDLERYTVPAARWAVFECRGKVPDSIVRAEMYAFTEWLPASGYVHALAPEMEVYLPGSDDSEDSVCEFWLPIASQGGVKKTIQALKGEHLSSLRSSGQALRAVLSPKDLFCANGDASGVPSA